MKIKDFDAFQSVYCGLCRTLRRRYGPAAGMLLSYDAAFLALLHMAVEEECSGMRLRRCPYPPWRRRPCCCGGEAALDLAADASVLLFYHKLRDARADAGFFKKLGARVLLPFFRPLYRRAAKNRPEAEKAVAAMMAEQSRVESRRSAHIDEAAQPTAAMVSALCALGAEGPQARVLARMGYFLGRWVYLMDAADDYAEDLKSGDYNVFALALRGGEGERLRLMSGALNPCVDEITRAAELLGLRSHEAVLRNILYLGLPHMQGAVLYGKSERAAPPGIPERGTA